MLRRTASASQIPLRHEPKNLFNARGPRPRSCSRNSNIPAPNIRSRRSSSAETKLNVNRLSRQQSPNRLSKVTPMRVPQFGRRSTQTPRLTPSSGQRSVGSSRIGSARADRQTIQKLSTDKKWVSQQFAKVQNFIETSGLFDLSIVTPSNIKPPSIKVFIYVMNVLLEEIFPNIKLSNENYKEIIPAKLKILHYPGTFTVSTLKTVNTTHSWPQVIGVFGWLVDKVMLSHGVEDMSLSCLEPEQRQAHCITKGCMKYLLKRHYIYNNNSDAEPEEAVTQATEECIQNLYANLGIDVEQFKKLENEVRKNGEYLMKQDRETQDLASEIETMQTQIQEYDEERAELESAIVTEGTELEEQLKYVQDHIAKLREKQATVIENVKRLQECIKTQPCSYQEKLTLLKRIDTLKNEIKIKTGKMEHAQRIKDEYDAKLGHERNILENAIVEWNRFLMDKVIKRPRLRPLLLKETGFHNRSFLTEIQEVLKEKAALEKELGEELQRVEREVIKEQVKKSELDSEIEELTNAIDNLNYEIVRASERIVASELELRNITSDLDRLKQSHAQTCQELQENDLEELRLHVEELKEKRDTLQNDLQKFSTKTLSFMVDVRKQIINNLAWIESVTGDFAEQLFTEISRKQHKYAKSLEDGSQ